MSTSSIFKRLQRYVEQAMPIGQLQRYGDFNTTTNNMFSPTDLRNINNDKFFEKLRTKFSKCPYQFDIFFVDHRNANKLNRPTGNEGAGHMVPSRVKRYIPEFYEYMKPIHNKHAITILIVSNAQDDTSVSLSPWMVAHRIAHSFADNHLDVAVSNSSIRKQMNQYITKVETICIELSKYKELGFDYERLFTFRSARINNVPPVEVPIELFAQYIITGKVAIVDYDATLFVGHDNDFDAKHISDLIKEIKSSTDYYIERILHRAIGKIFVI